MGISRTVLKQPACQSSVNPARCRPNRLAAAEVARTGWRLARWPLVYRFTRRDYKLALATSNACRAAPFDGTPERDAQRRMKWQRNRQGPRTFDRCASQRGRPAERYEPAVMAGRAPRCLRPDLPGGATVRRAVWRPARIARGRPRRPVVPTGWASDRTARAACRAARSAAAPARPRRTALRPRTR